VDRLVFPLEVTISLAA